MKYFSDTERGLQPRTKNEIPHNVWCGIVSHINTLIDTGYFGNSFPELCLDGQGCCGTNEASLSTALKAEVLGIDWPLLIEKDEDNDDWVPKKVPFTPDYLEVLDFIQFCFQHIAKPEQGSFHSYFGHYHLVSFDVEVGRKEFINKVNTIFSRNGLAYELKNDGQIIRILNAPLNQVTGTKLSTPDLELNDLIEKASKKITHPDVSVRYDALKDLWDGWERIKTLYAPAEGKKASMTKLLDATSNTPQFRAQLEVEAQALTTIGNAFFIRHSEISQVKLRDSDHIEYLFHRLASLLCLLSKKLV